MYTFWHMNFSPANITALVVAASFAAGLNIYATVLTLGILARTQWVALPPGLDSLGHTWVLVVCGIMFAMEFVADKIPGFDIVWNALHTVVRVPIAALVAYHASSQLTPQMQILATCDRRRGRSRRARIEDGPAYRCHTQSGARLQHRTQHDRRCRSDRPHMVRHAPSGPSPPRSR